MQAAKANKMKETMYIFELSEGKNFSELMLVI